MCTFFGKIQFNIALIRRLQSILFEDTLVCLAGVLNGIFTQVHGEDDGVREKAIKFLFVNLRKLPEEALNKECQDYIVEECKRVRIF